MASYSCFGVGQNTRSRRILPPSRQAGPPSALSVPIVFGIHFIVPDRTSLDATITRLID